MANVVIVVVLVVVVWYVGALVRRRSHGLVPKRGIGVAADLGVLADAPQVRVREVLKVGPGRVHLVLTPEVDAADGPGLTTSSDLDLVVVLGEEEFGFEQLREWKRRESLLALVVPPESRLVRLRSIDDLQPLTLHRIH